MWDLAMALLKFNTWDVCLGTAQNEFHAPYKVLDLLFIEDIFNVQSTFYL